MPNPGWSKSRFADVTEAQPAVRSGRDRYFWMFFASLCFGGLLALYQPIHTWLHAHLQFLLGVLIGSLLQVPGWLRDRWRWMKWFSHQ